MNSCELVTFISTLSCFISSIVSPDELSLLSVIFTQLGDSLATISLNNSLICNNENKDNNITKENIVYKN